MSFPTTYNNFAPNQRFFAVDVQPKCPPKSQLYISTLEVSSGQPRTKSMAFRLMTDYSNETQCACYVGLDDNTHTQIESIRAVFTRVSKVVRIFLGFTLLNFMMCSRNSRHFLSRVVMTYDDTRICEGEKVHSKVHSMRVCFVRPRNFPAMSIFFPPCQDLLCEAAGFCACCERTNNFCL